MLILAIGFFIDRIRATSSLIEAMVKSGKSESESECDIGSGLMLTLLTVDDTVNEELECEVEKLSFLETKVVAGFSSSLLITTTSESSGLNDPVLPRFYLLIYTI